MANRVAGSDVRLCSNLGVNQFGIRVVLLNGVHSLLVAFGALTREAQHAPDFIVLHNSVHLMFEEPCPFPFGWKPEIETGQPRICSAVCVLKHAIAEAAMPVKLEKKFAHLNVSDLSGIDDIVRVLRLLLRAVFAELEKPALR